MSWKLHRIFLGRTALPLSRKAEAPWGFPTTENVSHPTAHKYLKTTDASRSEGSRGLVSYLEKERKVAIVDMVVLQPGSLTITVECCSLQKLEELWHDYCTEHINKVAHKFLVTEDILEELSLTKVKVTTMISEEEYKDCRVHFLQNLGECDSLF